MLGHRCSQHFLDKLCFMQRMRPIENIVYMCKKIPKAHFYPHIPHHPNAKTDPQDHGLEASRPTFWHIGRCAHSTPAATRNLYFGYSFGTIGMQWSVRWASQTLSVTQLEPRVCTWSTNSGLWTQLGRKGCSIVGVMLTPKSANVSRNLQK